MENFKKWFLRAIDVLNMLFTLAIVILTFLQINHQYNISPDPIFWIFLWGVVISTNISIAVIDIVAAIEKKNKQGDSQWK